MNIMKSYRYSCRSYLNNFALLLTEKLVKR